MSFLKLVTETQNKDMSSHFEDICIGAFKKQSFLSKLPTYMFLVSGQHFTFNDVELVEFLKNEEFAFEVVYESIFSQHVSERIDRGYSLIVRDKDLGASAFASFQYLYSKHEGEFTHHYSAKFISTNTSVIDKIKEFFQSRKKVAKVKRGSVYMLVQEGNELNTKYIGTDFVPLERGNYTEEVLKLYDRTVSEFNKADSDGFLTIMQSIHGSGKTFCLRAMLGEIQDSIFVYVPPMLVSSLAGPSLVSALLDLKEEYGDNKRSVILLLEDADEVLVPRASDNMSSISTMLNLTDGILGRVLNMRIVATTNTNEKKFDKALMRPGRLCSFVKIERLTPEHGQQIYKRLTGKDVIIVKDHTLAEIYEMAKTGEEKPPEVSAEKVGF